MPELTLLDVPAAIGRSAPIAGIDPGERAIGVAVSDVTRMVASAVGVIDRRKFTQDAERLFALLDSRGAEALVIGLPVNMDGTEGPRCQSARAFGRNLLRLRPALVVAYWDERLSTQAVTRMLLEEADLSRARRDALVDKAAAAYILQGALDRLRTGAAQAGTPWRHARSVLEPRFMAVQANGLVDVRARTAPFPQRHFISASDLERHDIEAVLSLADGFVDLNRQAAKKVDLLKGRTLMNLFFENSTRTQSSFELAGKRLGADVVNMSPRSSSMSKGETLIDTAVTLNAMRPDLLVVRHGSSGAASLLARKVDCSVINAGDGQHEHPTQALLDALTLKRAFGTVEGLTVAICGDILHSRVARSNVIMLQTLGAIVRLVAPPTLLPAGADRWGVTICTDMREGVAGADVVMMLRLQLERMTGALVPSTREYFRYFGLDREKLALASKDVRVMHPGPMNRGVEIDSDIADDLRVSLIQNQVEMGVAVRMAVLAALAARLDNA